MECSPPSGVLLPGPSLTEGWPATNPALRLLEFDRDTFELLDVQTYTADLHAANKAGSLDWGLEYSFKDKFSMPDMSPASFGALADRMSAAAAEEWQAYRGMGYGSLFISGYTNTTAPVPFPSTLIQKKVCPPPPTRRAAESLTHFLGAAVPTDRPERTLCWCVPRSVHPDPQRHWRHCVESS